MPRALSSIETISAAHARVGTCNTRTPVTRPPSDMADAPTTDLSQIPALSTAFFAPAPPSLADASSGRPAGRPAGPAAAPRARAAQRLPLTAPLAVGGGSRLLTRTHEGPGVSEAVGGGVGGAPRPPTAKLACARAFNLAQKKPL